MPHIDRLTIDPGRFPTRERYPFNLALLQQTPELDLSSPVTLFVGENGTGKSTLLEAIARRCGIHIWSTSSGAHVERNPYQGMLHRCIDVHWTNGPVPGSFFSAQIFREFAVTLEDWAEADPDQLQLFGGKSLMSQSHGQSLMAFFRSRYQLKGLYLLDEPETALSPATQLRFVRLLRDIAAAGHAQFVICTHSPIILACPGARLYSFDRAPITPTCYKDTEHYRVYREFMMNPMAGLDAGND